MKKKQTEKQTKSRLPSREDSRGERIEWTGAGGDYFLGIVVSEQEEVIDERWGTREELLAWMEMRWPQLPAKYVPMVRGSRRQYLKRSATREKRRPKGYES